MWENILSALPLLFSPPVLLSMAVGTTLGVFIGALPGLSATMGIAVLIPLTFTMDPLVALGMMAGIYNGAMYGGAIPAILLRIPGTPAGIATVFDGHPMAKKGQGLEAMKIALTSSAIGGSVSALALLLLSPPLAAMALKFGPVEVFWLAVFGLAAIAVLLSDVPVKGLVSACLGLLIGMVGIDSMTGNERFTFNVMELTGGINILVLLTGLYAIPPALTLAQEASLIKKGSGKDKLGSNRKTVAWTRLVPTWCRASVIGVIVGIIPGTGGNIAAMLSWNETRRAAKDKSRFGKGAPEGVAAAECANNADNAASLIPALTLGIPGSTVSAVILGGLLVHGMLPGPELFTRSAPVTYGFILAMLVTSIMLFIIGRLGARLFINVMYMPPLMLAPIIIALTTVGVFAINNSIFDVWLMLLLGLVGWGMERLQIPLAPAVLAVILGPIAESNLRRAMLIGGHDTGILFSSTIAMVMVGAIVLTILSPLIRKVIATLTRQQKRQSTDTTPRMADGHNET
ncbi:putative tricarboxylic transport membrane protein [Modicisalibacter muralis]|uniref:Putative tricarboxylic transport membrane protein n=1 Tax=Modicisalibacter muralis TaxID=119000 RepID=A0A1G9RT64_9GAMM|nr:tripartite tricarboxylate transporter permease [Halomonas muralis]SDM25695.1 putative tricarboxylic transport membrane protein [Halomonas muralis]